MLVARNLWSRDEMILALNLYLKMPFGKMHKPILRSSELQSLSAELLMLLLIGLLTTLLVTRC